MGAVYRCTSVLSPRLTGALKVVEARTDPATRQRFVREIETMASLRHQALIRVLAAGEDAQRGLLYHVMELIDGEDLSQRLSRARLDWQQAARVFRDIADGLHHAHEAGVHHRDIKPANVMITREGGGVLVDFGIALDQDRTRLTEVGMVPGTVAYMPPELLISDSRSVDPALSDVYAFGLVFYEAVTSQRAFPGFQHASRRDLIRLVKEKLDRPPFDPGERIPAAIRGLIKGCTNADPLKRPRMKAVVRLLDIALGPTPGIAAATSEDVEPTMIMQAPPDASPTFPVDTVQVTPPPLQEFRLAPTPRLPDRRDEPVNGLFLDLPTEETEESGRSEADVATQVISRERVEEQLRQSGEPGLPPPPKSRSSSPPPSRSPSGADHPLSPAPFDDAFEEEDPRQAFDRSVIRDELARTRKPRGEPNPILMWGAALGLVVLLAGAAGGLLLGVWLWLA